MGETLVARMCFILVALILAGCGSHEIDSLEKWCEPTMGIDRTKKYNPWGLPFFVFSINENAVRDDFVKILDRVAVKASFDNEEIEENEFRNILGDKHKIPRLVWRVELALHHINLYPFRHKGKDFIEFWEQGLNKEKEYNHADPESQCIYGAAGTFFDSVNLHTAHLDKENVILEDIITVIPTGRLKG